MLVSKMGLKKEKFVVQVEGHHLLLACPVAMPLLQKLLLLVIKLLLCMLACYCFPVHLLVPVPPIPSWLSWLDWWCHIVVELLCCCLGHSSFILMMLIASSFHQFSIHLVVLCCGSQLTLLSSWPGEVTIVPLPLTFISFCGSRLIACFSSALASSNSTILSLLRLHSSPPLL